MKKTQSRKRGATSDWPTSKIPSYTQEIRTMLFAMGDSYETAKGTAELVESIVHEQVHELLNRAAQVCSMRGGTSIKQDDILFLMRNNVVKLARYLDYLVIKDAKSMVAADIEEPDSENALLDKMSAGKNYNAAIEIIKRFDSGSILTALQKKPVDVVKYERLLRLDRTSLNLDGERYWLFVKARTASFLHARNFSKFCEWLNCVWNNDEFKISDDAVEILGYLCRETIAELVDIALQSRRDAGFKTYNPLAGEEDASYALKVYPAKHGDKVDFFRPITPAEIREAARRATQLVIDPFGVCRNNIPGASKFRILCL